WKQAAAGNLRGGWRFLVGLPAALRQSAWSASGLTYRQLPLAQQSRFIQLVFSSEVERSKATVEDIASASLCVVNGDSSSGKASANSHPDYRFTYRYGGGALERHRREVSANGTSSNSEPNPPR